MLQPVLQSGSLLRRKLAELRIVFKRAALLCGRQIFIPPQPVSGVAGLILRWTGFIGAAGIGTTFFLKAVPLPVRMLRLWMLLLGRLRRRMADLSERRSQQKRCQTARNFCSSQHALVSC